MIVELALLFLLFLVYLLYIDRKPANMPPGPMEIPILGGVPIMDETAAEPLREKYGDIVTTRVGSLRTVFIFDYKTSKEAMAKTELSGRPEIFREFGIDEEKTGGVAGSIGEQWQHDRRFVIRSLRNLGMGKSYLEDAINIEAKALVEDLKMYKGEPINFPDSFRTVALNVIWQLVASKRYDLRSTEVDSIYKITKDMQSGSLALALLPMFFPSLKAIPKPIRNFLFMESAGDNYKNEMRNIVQATVTEHEKTFDIDNPRDLIDEYFKEMKEAEGDAKSLARKGALLQIVADLFDAGSDTVNSQLKWVIYLLAAYPHVAQKLQQEIDENVPRDRLVSFGDKPCLPYVEAFLTEMLRFSSLVPINVLRSALVDTTLQGYNIPKGTMVQSVNYTINYDPKRFTEPNKFTPERFIDEDGKYRGPKDGLFSFGSGRRVCPGEPLAKMELFLFLSAIIQNFDIKVPEGTTLKHTTTSSLGLRLPDDKTFIYSARS